MRRDGENWSEEESIFNEQDRRKGLGRVSNGIHIIERRERFVRASWPREVSLASSNSARAVWYHFLYKMFRQVIGHYQHQAHVPSERKTASKPIVELTSSSPKTPSLHNNTEHKS